MIRLGIAVFVSLALSGCAPAFAACVDVPSEKETTNEYVEYKEVVRADGCHFLVYVRQWNDPKEGWLESGWMLHRKNCPCGWYEKQKGLEHENSVEKSSS